MRAVNTRRVFLKIAGALGGLSVVGSAVGQEDDVEEDADIVLGGRTSGWEGVYPEEIEGEHNPTLELVDGEDYVLVWENEDGAPHNFVIESEDGEDVVETDTITSGEQTVEFTASAEMSEYYCAPHPARMRGEIEIVEDDEPDEEPEDVDEEDPEEFAAEVDDIYELRLDDEGWHGVFPEEIEEEESPTLEVSTEGVYVVRFTNDIGEFDPDEDELDDDVDDEMDDDVADEDDELDDGMDDDVADEDDEMDVEADDEEPEPEPDEIEHEEGNNLVIVAEDDEEVVATHFFDPGESGAVVFTGREDLVGYRDDSSGEEGEIDVTDEPIDDDEDEEIDDATDDDELDE